MSLRARALLALVVVLLSLGVMTSGASAASLTTDCSGLQAALDQAVSGDTITLTELCTGQNFDYTGNQSFTLEGRAGSTAGFNGGAGGRPLSFFSASSPTSITLRNLVFENGSQPSSGGAVAFQGEYSVTLDHDTFTNNQTTPGPGGAVDVETTTPSATVTLTNDSFTNNQAPDGAGLGGAVNIAIFGSSGTLTLDGDTFTGNQAGVGGGAVEVTQGATSGSLTVSNSTFQNNTANTDTGGALDLCECGGPVPVAVSHNTFSGNKVVGGGCGCVLGGGAVFLDNSSGGNAALTQTGNTFSGNSLTGGTGDVEGGAESASGFTLSSTSDLFTGNSVQAPASGQVSQGAALSLENDCSSPIPQHTLTNAAIGGNSIGDGGVAASAQGALNIHCILGTTDSNSLLLRSTTISGNTGGGGTAGIWGDAHSQATLQNSILNGNSDGGNLGGFPGGSTTATYTNLCNGISPFTGTGNICADPKLVDASSGDVHETFSSPTVDAGSNALVPNGLTTDVYGGNRIQPKLVGGTATVDMGAAELATIQKPTASITTPASGATYAVGQAVTSSFGCSEGTGGPGISSCLDQSGNATGGPVDTATPGFHTFTVTATSSDGLTGTASVSYTVAAAPTAPSASITTPASGATYAVGQAVTSSFACSEGTGGPGISSCLDQSGNATGGPVDTATPGFHTFTVTATSSDGLTGTASVSYTVTATPPPTPKPPSVSINTPRRGARYAFGARVLARFSCAEGTGGPGLGSCVGTAKNGSPIDTSMPGTHTFTVEATSSDRQATTQSVRYTVAKPSNRFVKRPHLAPRSGGRFIVTVKIPHPGRVDILVTAWKNSFAVAAGLPTPRPVLLQPGMGRFVFARAHAIAARATTLRILVRPNARGRRLVAHHRRGTTLRLWISYTPAGGHPGKIGYYGLHLP